MRKFAAASLAVLLALSSSAPVFAQGAPKNITVLANYTFHGRHSPFFVALDKGFFEQAGFKVDIQPATGSGFVISAIEAARRTTVSPTRARRCRRSRRDPRSRDSRSTWTSPPTASRR